MACTDRPGSRILARRLSWLAGLTELRNVTYVDLPTSHWPMWSRLQELAEIIGDVAKAHAAAME